MINMINVLKFKNLLVILFVGISLVVWAYQRETRKIFFNFLFPSETIHIMIKGRSSKVILTLSSGEDNQNILFNNRLEEFNFSGLFPFNGQIILEK